jgi:hypothetical protein
MLDLLTFAEQSYCSSSRLKFVDTHGAAGEYITQEVGHDSRRMKAHSHPLPSRLDSSCIPNVLTADCTLAR